MRNKLVVAVAVLFLFNAPVVAMAGMNHQPHNAKTFMGKERKEVKQEKKEQQEPPELQEKKREKEAAGGHVPHRKHQRPRGGAGNR